jgi:hypothetical protein
MINLVNGYNEGADITLFQVIYHKPKKDPETGKYGKDSLDLIYYDNITNEKKVEHIVEPEYTFYYANDDTVIEHNELFIEKDKVHPIACKYKDIKKTIAEVTGNLDYFYDNIRNGNYRENDKLFKHPRVFLADMNIEDYYRFEFNKFYKNTPRENLTNIYFDIEVDTSEMNGDFPEPGECPVNACSLVCEPNQTIYCLLLEDDNNPLIEQFKQEKDLPEQIKEFVKENVGGWKQEIRNGLDKYEYKFLFYDEEIKLINDIFNIINILKPDFALAWNMAFDVPYLIQRIINLGYSPEEICCHQDFNVKEAYYYIDKRADKFEERGDYCQISCYTVYLDQLITFASRRKGQRQLPSYKLDYIGGRFAKVKKLDYSHITTSLAKLPFLNYKVFAFYNIMDTIVQKCVENKVSDIDFVYNKSMVNNTRYHKIHRQTVYLANRGIKDFWDMGYVMGCNINKSNDPTNISDKPKIKINGVPIMVFNNLVDFDYARLYPSIIFENNIAPNTMIGKLELPDQLDEKEDRFNNDFFSREVAFIEDFCSHDYINFGERYLGLAGYEEMFDDIIEFFRTIRNPGRGLMINNNATGQRIMCYNVMNDKPRPMCRLVEPGEKRIMVIRQQKMEVGGLNGYKNS